MSQFKQNSSFSSLIVNFDWLVQMIGQASGILLMCCPWLSVIIGWIKDLAWGKRQSCFQKPHLSSELLLLLRARMNRIALKRPPKT